MPSSPFKAFVNSCNGLKTAWAEDKSFRNTTYQFAAGIAAATVIAINNNSSPMIWLLMVGSLFPMMIAETVNCSVEAVTDKASPERSALAKKAKDMGSAAVLIARIFAILCWIVALNHI